MYKWTKAILFNSDSTILCSLSIVRANLISWAANVALPSTHPDRDWETLTNFSLELTSPSVVLEQEKIELLKAKTELAGELLGQGLVPSDWIYDNVYQFSEDQYEEYRDLSREDAKRKFRLAQIEAEGNDPVQTGKSYGTPLDRDWETLS